MQQFHTQLLKEIPFLFREIFKMYSFFRIYILRTIQQVNRPKGIELTKKNTCKFCIRNIFEIFEEF